MASIEAAAREFRAALSAYGLYDALGVLNATCEFRFTGVYRFERDMVINVVLYDRENPGLKIGEDVRLHESYCRMTAVAGDRCTIEDSRADPRLTEHAARDAVQSYGAVLLKGSQGGPLGTLCHFDVRPVRLGPEVFELLEAVRPDVERAVLSRQGLPHREPGTTQIADFSALQVRAE